MKAILTNVDQLIKDKKYNVPAAQNPIHKTLSNILLKVVVFEVCLCVISLRLNWTTHFPPFNLSISTVPNFLASETFYYFWNAVFYLALSKGSLVIFRLEELDLLFPWWHKVVSIHSFVRCYQFSEVLLCIADTFCTLNPGFAIRQFL